MRRLDAQEVLRAHVVERHRRATIKAQCLEEDAGMQPGMSGDAWVTSCLLARGIATEVLDFLAVLYCDANGTEMRRQTVDWRNGDWSSELQPFAKPLTVKQAAQRAGWDAEQAKAAVRAAVNCVAENMIARAGRAA